MKALNRNFTNEVSKIKFSTLLFAFSIALLLPALWSALEWNLFYFDLWQTGKRTFLEYWQMLLIRFFFLFAIGLFLVFILGLPLFYTLKRFLPFKLTTVCLIAALIAILPNVLIEISSHLNTSENTNFSYTRGDCNTINNGERTACGWKIFFIDNILMVALKGALAGLVFWFVMTFRYWKKETKA